LIVLLRTPEDKKTGHKAWPASWCSRDLKDYAKTKRFTIPNLDIVGRPPPVMENPSYIVPVRVGDPVHCKAVTDSLLNHYGVYVLPINGPTVPRGVERTRFTPTPVHSDAQISDLIATLKELWVACPVGKGQYIRLAAE
jgi:Aminotransferase class I and II